MRQTLLDMIGASILSFTNQAGDFVTVSARSFVCIFRRPFDGRSFLYQLGAVGADSVPVVSLTSLAISMVFAVQLAFALSQFQAEGMASQVEGVALVRELSPVITGLMMAGRAGTAMAAELASMQVTEQIDALECLATDPVQYLFVPRLLAAAVMLPLLTAFSIFVGYLGGYGLLVLVQGQSAWVYHQEFYKLLQGRDLVIAMAKALVFGLIIALVGCWRGYRTRGGAVEVGIAPTRSVVESSLWILIADFFLTKLLLV
jgi:phospholipid/cholesterol/gamma-HCH transport system permease protein